MKVRTTSTSVSLLIVASTGHALAADWTVTDMQSAAMTSSQGLGAAAGQQVGAATFDVVFHAVVWKGTPESAIDLNLESELGWSYAYDAFGSQQVGLGGLIGSSDPHAILWSGTPESWIDLHPPGMIDSYAYGIADGQQVGTVTLPGGAIHASLWSGTAASWVDLNPPGHLGSYAYDVSQGQQVGFATSAGQTHASLWQGTANSWVDLHPAGAGNVSWAYAVWHGQQGGFAKFGSTSHAGIWSGSSASWVDLHPSGASFSAVIGLHAGRQVGAAKLGGQSHAGIWTGTAESWEDLHLLLPPGEEWLWSEARGVSSDGTTLSVFGYAVTTLGEYHAILWTTPDNSSSCYADCDESGDLTIDDFICFQTLFAVGSNAADCDSSGSLDIDDFICFQTLFAIGC